MVYYISVQKLVIKLKNGNSSVKLKSWTLMTGLAVSGILASGAFAPAQAVGVLLTEGNESGYTGPRLDLTAYETGINNYIDPALSIPGGISFSGIFPTANLGQSANYYLGDNGWIDSNAVYASSNSYSGSEYIQFSFASPVQSFGAFLNYANYSSVSYANTTSLSTGISIPLANSTGPIPDPIANNPIISTYDVNGNLLSYFDLSTDGAITTVNGLNQFVFRGISEDSAIISSFRLSGSNIVAAATANGSANGSSSTAVPEPFTIIGTIVGGSAALRMRKKLKAGSKV
jgi:hypothetical protein